MKTDPLDDRQRQSLRQLGYREPLGHRSFSHATSIAALAGFIQLDGMRVIEPACNEGYATAALALCGARVDAFDIRPPAVVRAFGRCLYHDIQDRVRLSVGDAESVLRSIERDEYQLLFHAGLLYHLPEPAQHLRAVAGLCKWMFLDTHTANPESELPSNDFLSPEITVRDGYGGRAYTEGGWLDELSGVSDVSFWLLENELWRLIRDCDLLVEGVISTAGNSSGRRLGVLLRRGEK